MFENTDCFIRGKWNSSNIQGQVGGIMLILPIKKKWFDMILLGEKKEEYREIKPYYESRFTNLWKGSLIGGLAEREILFRNGYSKNSPSFIAKCSVKIGCGNPEWGAEKGKPYYILEIHEITDIKLN